jgi:hypothetical protein
MPRPRMTLQGWMITIALAALVLGMAMEGRRHANDRHGPGYDRARAVFALRGQRQTSGGYRTDDAFVIIGVVATALIGGRLRRRFQRLR